MKVQDRFEVTGWDNCPFMFRHDQMDFCNHPANTCTFCEDDRCPLLKGNPLVLVRFRKETGNENS